MLSDEVIVESYTDPSDESYNLENSSLYQYIITAVNNNGDESLPSDLIEFETLPEYVPEAPESLFLISGQNSIELNWNPEVKMQMKIQLNSHMRYTKMEIS